MLSVYYSIEKEIALSNLIDIENIPWGLQLKIVWIKKREHDI